MAVTGGGGFAAPTPTFSGAAAPAPTPFRPPLPTQPAPGGTFYGSPGAGGFGNTHPGFGGSASNPPPAIPSNPTPGGPSSPGPSSYLTDPGYLAALAAQQQGDSQINAMLNKQIADAIVNYGDPALAQMAGFGLDNQSAAFARQNYLSGNSTLARLDKAHSLARQHVIDQLAGHGLLFSGDTGYQRGQQDQLYGNNVYDAQHAVLNAIGGYRQTALQEQQQLQQQVVQALQQAYANFLAYGSAYFGGAGGPGGGAGGGPSNPNTNTIPFLPSFSGRTITGPSPKAPSAPVKAVAHALVNPYTTGQKRRG